MDWLVDLFSNTSGVAYTVIVYAFVIGLGVALGRLRFFGISFGIACVLFVGIFVSHFGFVVNHSVEHFVKEFGLILFVYTIGLQVGPGFFASFGKEGLRLNGLALLSAFSCVATVVGIHYISEVPMAELVGIMSGAVTNTPGLGAAQQTLAEISGGTFDKDALSIGYAVTYPFGVLGIILIMLAVRFVFGVNVEAEIDKNNQKSGQHTASVDRIALVVQNPILFEKSVPIIRHTLGRNFVISRLCRNNEIILVDKNTVLKENDVLLLVANPSDFEKLSTLIGPLVELAIFDTTESNIVSRRLNVTSPMTYSKRLGDINLREKFGVTISRVYRAGVEFIPTPTTKLQFGDTITVVGDETHIKAVEKVIGNSKKRLRHPHIAELFFGIMLGVFVGSIPLHLPGIPIPVKLGLAGGPLIVAILISRFGGTLSVTHYVSNSANLMVREIGIVLFLASVGLGAGQNFIKTIVQGDGLYWMFLGALITLVPLVVISIVGRIWLKLNYLEICGLLSGTQTDPPALAFAHDITGSEAPAVAYASVYPLMTFLRIMIAQLLIVLFYS